VYGTGRTDTGVHAKQMYAHFDFETPFDVLSLVHKLNSFYQRYYGLRYIAVADEAHARFLML
jgi:tRNA pseudouridine38-40 synthase